MEDSIFEVNCAVQWGKWMAGTADTLVRFSGRNMRKFLIEATFAQAKHDGIAILEIGEDVWGLNEFFHNDIVELIETFQEINERIAPEVCLRLQIGLSRHCPVDYLEGCLKHFWGHPERQSY